MQIADWLQKLGMSEYAERFAENRIDLSVLPDLTDQHLKDLGIALGDRLKMLRAIRELADPPTAPAPAKMVLGPQDAAERRQLTVMFCDLVGSTALSARMDPEDLREVISAYQAACVNVIRTYDGLVAKFMGDGILAYFGYPQAHEDDAERAVRTGLDIIRAVGQLKTRALDALKVRIGIATGVVVVGDLIGSGEAQERGVVGETPNLAARLQGMAEPNTIVIGPRTRRLLADLFEYQDLGGVGVKGFAAPVHAYQVLRPSTVESRFEAFHSTALTPLVGRDEEIELLIRRWQHAKEGDGSVVLISGEPGIGKSRIAQAVQGRLGTEPYTRLRYFCSPHHQDALYPIINQLERAAGFRRDDTVEQRLTKLETVLAQATNDLSDAAPLLAELLSIPAGERYSPLNFTPQKRKEKTLKALLARVEGLAARQPVLMVFEDAHWMDPTTRESLDLVIDRVSALRVLVIVTYRPEFTPPWVGRSHVTLLSLNRLQPRQGADMIAWVVGGKALPKEIIDQIIDRTDGVPLFIEELTKAVIESGVLAESGDGYDVTGPIAPLAIPTSLHASLLARLDRLAPVREVAQIAAALGRQFSHELISAAAPMPQQELDYGLEQLVRAELIFRRGTPPDAEYTFKHALVQDAAYQSLLRSRRQQVHHRIAQALVERFPEVAEVEPALVAHHYTEAGLDNQGITFWLKAGQRAIQRSANLEAINYLTRGLHILNTQPESPTRDEAELMLQTTLGVPLIAAKGMAAPEVERTYARARNLCIRVGDTPQLFSVLFGLWWFYEVRADLRPAHGLAEQLLEIAHSLNDAALLVQAHRAMGQTLFWLGEFASAQAQFEQGIALYDPHQHRSLMLTYGQEPGVLSRGFAAHVLWYLGYPERALKVMHEALALAQDVGHPLSLAFALDHTAWLHQYRGECIQTRERAEADVKHASEQGFPFFLAQGTILRGWALAEQGQETEGIAQMSKGLAAHRATGAQLIQPYWTSLLAWAQGKGGHVDHGLRLLDEALQMMHEQNVWGAELQRLKGELLLFHTGDAPGEAAIVAGEPAIQAESCFRQGLKIASGQRAKSLELRAATSLARLWHDQGKRDEARDLLAPIYNWFTEGFDTPILIEAKALLEQLTA